MNDAISSFSAKGEELADMLAVRGVKHWPMELRSASAKARQNPQAGATQYLSFVGGMGSLTDVWICRANGHSVTDDEEVAVNRAVDQLQNELFTLAKAIERQ